MFNPHIPVDVTGLSLEYISLVTDLSHRLSHRRQMTKKLSSFPHTLMFCDLGRLKFVVNKNKSFTLLAFAQSVRSSFHVVIVLCRHQGVVHMCYREPRSTRVTRVGVLLSSLLQPTGRGQAPTLCSVGALTSQSATRRDAPSCI